MTVETELGEIRRLFDAIKAGTHESFAAWAELASLLLRRSILSEDAGLCLIMGPYEPSEVVQVLRGGRAGDEYHALLLRDGRYLRFSQTLTLVATDDGPRMKVAESSYQYQLHPDSAQDWLFRYDYTRIRDDDHPPGHFHIAASPTWSDGMRRTSSTAVSRSTAAKRIMAARKAGLLECCLPPHRAPGRQDVRPQSAR